MGEFASAPEALAASRLVMLSTTPATTPAAPPTAAAIVPATPPVRSVSSLALFMTLFAADLARAGALETIDRALLAARLVMLAPRLLFFPPLLLVAPPPPLRADFDVVDFLLPADEAELDLLVARPARLAVVDFFAVDFAVDLVAPALRRAADDDDLPAPVLFLVPLL